MDRMNGYGFGFSLGGAAIMDGFVLQVFFNEQVVWQSAPFDANDTTAKLAAENARTQAIRDAGKRLFGGA